MTDDIKKEITKLSKKFSSAFKDTIGEINGSGWLIVDPLSGYLNSIGYENELKELQQTKDSPQILVMIFKDGSQFIPAGKDLKNIYNKANNWMWL